MDKPRLLTEVDAAALLGISKATLARERMAGRVHPIRIGQRIIRYTEDILAEYLQQCTNTQARSATSGFPRERAPTTGAGRGSTPPPDRHDAFLLAQATFKKAN